MRWLIPLILLVAVSGCTQSNRAPGACDRFLDPNARQECYLTAAMNATSAISQCIAATGSIRECASTESLVALRQTCSLLLPPVLEDRCYSTVAFLRGGARDCHSIANDTLRDDCIAFMVDQTYRCRIRYCACISPQVAAAPDSCDNISDANRRTFCKIVAGDQSVVCDDVTDPVTQVQCMDAASILRNTRAYVSDGKTYRYIAIPDLTRAMDWIRDNVPDDAIVTSWYDYGHMIQDLGGRQSLVFTPSQELITLMSIGGPQVTVFPPDKLDTLFDLRKPNATLTDSCIWNKEKSGDLSPDADLRDVARILTATDPAETRAIMGERDSDYILVSALDPGKAAVMLQVATGRKPDVSTSSQRLLLHRMVANEDISGFKRVYSDPVSVVYMRTG